jgi:hypothetical protein
MVAHGLVQNYLDDCGGEWSGFKMDRCEEALVINIAHALRIAGEEE